MKSSNETYISGSQPANGIELGTCVDHVRVFVGVCPCVC